MKFNPANRTTIGSAGQDMPFADYDRAREFATRCWRRVLRRRMRPLSVKEA